MEKRTFRRILVGLGRVYYVWVMILVEVLLFKPGNESVLKKQKNKNKSQRVKEIKPSEQRDAEGGSAVAEKLEPRSFSTLRNRVCFQITGFCESSFISHRTICLSSDLGTCDCKLVRER